MSHEADARPQGHVPLRTCVGCRERDERSTLVRVVCESDTIVVDAPGTAPGRGAWLHRTGACLALAIKRKAIGRALRVPQADASVLTGHSAFVE